jgi:hypothetical protein
MTHKIKYFIFPFFQKKKKQESSVFGNAVHKFLKKGIWVEKAMLFWMLFHGLEIFISKTIQRHQFDVFSIKTCFEKHFQRQFKCVTKHSLIISPNM